MAGLGSAQFPRASNAAAAAATSSSSSPSPSPFPSPPPSLLCHNYKSGYHLQKSLRISQLLGSAVEKVNLKETKSHNSVRTVHHCVSIV